MTYLTGTADASVDDSPAASRLVDKVVADLTGLIRSQHLRAGDALPGEAALALQFGVSRPVIREAVRAMSSLGLIDVGNGRRARVSLVPPDVMALIVDHAVHVEQISVQQVMDVRRTIELRTVALAAIRRSEEEAASIVAEAAAMRAARDDFPLMTEHDIAFHIAIARASKNPMFTLLIEALKVVTRQTAPVTWTSRRSEGERDQVFEQHDAIADAILRREPDRAVAAMQAHFDLSVKALISAGIL